MDKRKHGGVKIGKEEEVQIRQPQRFEAVPQETQEVIGLGVESGEHRPQMSA